MNRSLIRTTMALLLAVFSLSLASTANAATPSLLSNNCDPAEFNAATGTSFFGVTESSGLQNPHVGTTANPCSGPALLPAYDGHRGVEDVSSDGRYVLYVKAVCNSRDQNMAIPGKGVNNTLAIWDRQTNTDTELFPRTDFCGFGQARTAIIWADFSPDMTQVSWTQKYSDSGCPLAGCWDVHVADLSSSLVLHNERVWHPSAPAFSEVYGWVPGTNRVIFTSNDGTGGGMLCCSRLWTVDAATMSDKQPVDSLPNYHEFANWTLSGDLLSSLTYKAGKGGVDLWDLTTGQRITYFNGDKNVWGSTIPVAGWPTPTYTNVLGGVT
jgi:hypothetical protein